MPTTWRQRWRRRASLLLLGGVGCTTTDRPVQTRSIEIQPRVALRESGDSVTFGDDIGLIAGPNAGYVALRVRGPRAMAFYDSSGVVRHLLATSGRGPGEFSAISSAAFGPGDSLFIGDAENGRLTVLSPNGFRVARQAPAPMSEMFFKGTPQGRLFNPMMAQDGEKGMVAFTLRRVPWNGTRPVAIASAVPMERFGASAPDSQGRMWVADRRTYTLRLFDGNRVVRTIARRPDWFPADTSPITQPAWMGKGRPFIADLSVGEDGVLWVLIKRKNPHYGDTTMSMTRFISPMGLPPLAEIFEGVLEAIDPATGVLIDSRIVPGDMISFIAPSRLYQRTDADSSGALKLQVWDVRLRTPD
jgi:hypothetical protein